MTSFPASYEAVPAGAQWRHRHQPQPVRHQVRPGAEAGERKEERVHHHRHAGADRGRGEYFESRILVIVEAS